MYKTQIDDFQVIHKIFLPFGLWDSHNSYCEKSKYNFFKNSNSILI